MMVIQCAMSLSVTKIISQEPMESLVTNCTNKNLTWIYSDCIVKLMVRSTLLSEWNVMSSNKPGLNEQFYCNNFYLTNYMWNHVHVVSCHSEYLLRQLKVQSLMCV